MRDAMPSILDDWERWEKEHSVTYPCEEASDPGQSVVFEESFPTADGRGRFVPAELKWGMKARPRLPFCIVDRPTIGTLAHRRYDP
ncbi:MAG: hypothetical protein CM1200mP18_20010 [Gammaproteobacteria bacterium]|nr:MAG: hypothetical protein CM1200mP18_20010 [Gammaproteobacteria bacterium]